MLIRVRGVTCPALRRYTAKKIESDHESIGTLAGPNIYTLTRG